MRSLHCLLRIASYSHTKSENYSGSLLEGLDEDIVFSAGHFRGGEAAYQAARQNVKDLEGIKRVEAAMRACAPLHPKILREMDEEPTLKKVFEAGVQAGFEGAGVAVSDFKLEDIKVRAFPISRWFKHPLIPWFSVLEDKTFKIYHAFSVACLPEIEFRQRGEAEAFVCHLKDILGEEEKRTPWHLLKTSVKQEVARLAFFYNGVR